MEAGAGSKTCLEHKNFLGAICCEPVAQHTACCPTAHQNVIVFSGGRACFCVHRKLKSPTCRKTCSFDSLLPGSAHV